MTGHYIDPSAWVKRHFREAGSEAVNALFRIPVDGACCSIGLVEMLATVARKWFAGICGGADRRGDDRQRAGRLRGLPGRCGG